MNLVTAAAIRHLRAHDWRLFPPPAIPPYGSIWAPGLGHKPFQRQVTMATETHVSYRPPVVGVTVDKTITLRAWVRWRQRVRAKRVA